MEPVPQRLDASLAHKQSYDRLTKNAVDAEDCECETQDGVKVHLFANVGRPFEIDQVVRHHNATGKLATVCGEAAADPRVACLLVGLGARSFSMNPVSAALVRHAVRASHQDSLEELAHAALRARAKISSHCSRPDLIQVWTIRLSKTAGLARLI